MKEFFKKYKIELFVFGLALSVRILVFGINFHASNGDILATIHGDDGYYEISQGILHGHGFTGSTEEPFIPNTLRTPLYIYFISAILYIFGSLWVVLFAQLIIGSLIPILGRRIALELNPSRRIAFWTAILLSLEPYLVLFSSIFYTETLFIFIFLIFILIFLKYIKEGNARALVLSSFVLGLATLTKTTVQYLPIILVLLILWRFRKIFSKWRLLAHASVFLSLFILTLSPWLYRNYRVFGVVGMTAQPAYNSYVYLVPSVLSIENGTSFNQELNKFVTVDESSGNKITLANSSLYTKKAFDVLKDHPVGLIKSMAITVVTFFTHDGMLTVLEHAGYVPDMYMSKPAISLLASSPLKFLKTISLYIMSPFILVLIMRLVWIIITLFFLIGLARFMKNRKYDTVSIFIFAIVLYFVATSAIGGLGVNARYRMPITPIILTMSLTGFVYMRSVILARHANR